MAIFLLLSLLPFTQQRLDSDILKDHTPCVTKEGKLLSMLLWAAVAQTNTLIHAEIEQVIEVKKLVVIEGHTVADPKLGRIRLEVLQGLSPFLPSKCFFAYPRKGRFQRCTVVHFISP